MVEEPGKAPQKLRAKTFIEIPGRGKAEAKETTWTDQTGNRREFRLFTDLEDQWTIQDKMLIREQESGSKDDGG